MNDTKRLISHVCVLVGARRCGVGFWPNRKRERQKVRTMSSTAPRVAACNIAGIPCMSQMVWWAVAQMNRGWFRGKFVD
jgi:hypothetical protein